MLYEVITVLKPLCLSASRGVIRADTPEQFVRAWKTIARDLAADVDPVELFEREAQTIAQLEHRNNFV